MPQFCAACGTQMPDESTFCPKCGRQTASAAAGGGTVAGGTIATTAGSTTGGMSDNVAGMLAYITIIPAIVFLVMEPYNKSRFIRFHSFQNIFFHVAWFVLWIVLATVAHIPFLGWLTILVWPLIGLGGLILWIVLLLKAYQGQMFKLPFIGDLAEKQANVV
jgi:uncharacterized membrane protein